MNAPDFLMRCTSVVRRFLRIRGLRREPRREDSMLCCIRARDADGEFMHILIARRRPS
ncbi:MAG: hypothetical protein WB784_02285 [Rhodanobacteraceae bacterium]